MRYYFLIICFGLSSCAVVSDKWYCENTFSAYKALSRNEFEILKNLSKRNLGRCD